MRSSEGFGEKEVNRSRQTGELLACHTPIATSTRVNAYLTNLLLNIRSHLNIPTRRDATIQNYATEIGAASSGQ